MNETPFTGCAETLQFVLDAGLRFVCYVAEHDEIDTQTPGPYRIQVYHYPSTQAKDVLVASGPTFNYAVKDLSDAIKANVLDMFAQYVDATEAIPENA